jgi:hypothetical protein
MSLVGCGWATAWIGSGIYSAGGSAGFSQGTQITLGFVDSGGTDRCLQRWEYYLDGLAIVFGPAIAQCQSFLTKRANECDCGNAGARTNSANGVVRAKSEVDMCCLKKVSEGIRRLILTPLLRSLSK